MRERKLVGELRESVKDIGYLYPVLKAEDTGEVLDGRDRLAADPCWPTKTVKVKDDLARLKIKHHANWHRKSIDRGRVLTEIAEATGWRGLEPFAEFLDVSIETISEYLPQKYLRQIQNHNKGSTSLNLLKDFDFRYSVWDAEYSRPEGYGSREFRGNCSPTVVYGLLSRYSTLEDDLILDPMAGSGTFYDVARAMGYREDQILCFDVKPMHEAVEVRDAEDTGLDDESVDFIFAHYPYWNLIEYTVDDPRDLSRLSKKEFLEKSERIMREMHRVLRKDRFFTVMIGNRRWMGVIDLEAAFSVMGCKYFTLWDKIIKMIRTWKQETRGQRMGLEAARAKASNRTIVNHDTLLVFRKD